MVFVLSEYITESAKIIFVDQTNLVISLFNQDCGFWLLSILNIFMIESQTEIIRATVRTALTINRAKDRVTI